MSIKQLPTILISAAVAACLSFSLAAHKPQKVVQQSVYERVISSGILRCGYFPEAPFTIIDPNTGKKSGIAVELAEKIAEELNLKLEWVSAENFTALTQDLDNGRYDAICASTFNLPRAGHIDYTIPYAYVPVYGYTQAGRTDLDNKLDLSSITIGGLEGESATATALKKFPRAKSYILPENAHISDMLESVVTRKADVAFVMPTVLKNFNDNNPNALRKVASDKPFHVFNVGFGLKSNEAGFKNTLDFVIRNLTANGYLDSLFRKYDPDGLLFEPQKPYLQR